MTQYLLSVYNVEGEAPPSDEEFQQSIKDVGVLNEEIRAAGAWVFAGGLHADAASTATVVRSVDGKIVTTDGPFAETKESLGGFWIIEVDDLDAALAWAAKGTVACSHPLELKGYQPYHATRADVLRRLGRHSEATAEYDSAIDLSTSAAEGLFLENRRSSLEGST